MFNIDTNKKFWDAYANRWDNLSPNLIENDLSKNELQYIGDEWGNPKDVEEVLDKFVYPNINKDSVVAEIGVGGGRIASKVANSVDKLVAFDISSIMIEKSKQALKEFTNIDYRLIHDPRLLYDGQFDFIYSFDVFVHLDMHIIWQYLESMKDKLKEEGKVFLHTANLESEAGWDRFISNHQYAEGSFYEVIPEIIRIFAKKVGFKVTDDSYSNLDKDNYYQRDYLFILEHI